MDQWRDAIWIRSKFKCRMNGEIFFAMRMRLGFAEDLKFETLLFFVNGWDLDFI
jgi:hypothetical protein